MIKVEALEKSFGPKKVLTDISLDIQKGEVVAIIGPSGSGKANKKMSKKEAETYGLALLNRVGLSAQAKQYPVTLSGGQQQRVSIARALAVEPHALLFDEPTSTLDPELVGEVLQVIRELAKQETTMVIVTHEMQFAKEVANRVVFMEDGKILHEGTPEEVLSSTTNARMNQFLKSIN